MDTNASTSSKLDVYEIVNDLLIERLETGIIPWREPWINSGMPTNLISLRPYRAINLWLLAARTYSKKLYLTWHQVKQVGGSVNRGEHGHVVVYWKMIPQEKIRMVHEKTDLVPLLQYYKVFNISQCRDLPEDLVARAEAFPQSIDAGSSPKKKNSIFCEAIYNNMPLPPEIKYETQMALYNPAQDYISMPRKKSYKEPSGYYAALFHQLIHATGHESRLNRSSLLEMSEHGADSYSIEELIAEMGTSYLCYHAGVLPTPLGDYFAYLNGWLDKLRHDKHLVVTASVYAQRAVDYILGYKEATSEKKEEADVP
ncbi:MAG: zincin-like metallopeptidase domain-containing protein [Bacteroidota bacterium]